MNQDHKVFKLKGTIQHYAWGGRHYLPDLLSAANPENKPFAEYWLGAHDNAPSQVEIGAGNVSIPLNKYIQESPQSRLGAYVNGTFGRLPYLLKILDVADMLSIQVHPSKKSAELEFAAENAKGVALNAPNRNYKDDNHKPELMMALSEFWLLHGFKPKADLKRMLHAVHELSFLAPVFEQQGYQGLYKTVMEMGQEEVNRILQPLLDRIIPAYQEHRLARNQEDFWAARAALAFNEPGRIDRGIFSIYLFNLVNLHPGEAIFQDAGLPHAYLEGQNVEIMANSDNVLRGGLTPKHIDVPELLKHVVFEETFPKIITGDAGDGQIAYFYTPAPDFELARIRLSQHDRIKKVNRSAGIFIVLNGRLRVEEEVTGGATSGFERGRGEAFVAFNEARLGLQALEDTEVYWASVPMAL